MKDEDRYRLLIDSITDYAIYMLDPNGIVTSWNPGARRFKGYEASEIIGQHFERFYTEEDRKAGLPVRALKTARESNVSMEKVGTWSRCARQYLYGISLVRETKRSTALGYRCTVHHNEWRLVQGYNASVGSFVTPKRCYFVSVG